SRWGDSDEFCLQCFALLLIDFLVRNSTVDELDDDKDERCCSQCVDL
ncbi:unnamed protein product, partial [Rotaria magnacalcarata]